jgi:hypothetical protein
VSTFVCARTGAEVSKAQRTTPLADRLILIQGKPPVGQNSNKHPYQSQLNGIENGRNEEDAIRANSISRVEFRR